MKKILLLAAAAVFSAATVSAEDTDPVKPEIIKTEMPYNVMGISASGNFICGTRQSMLAYRYDLVKKNLEVSWCDDTNMDIVAYDVMDDGTVVGSDKYGNFAFWLPNSDEWKKVEATNGNVGVGAAFQCSGDGKYLAGFTSGEKSDTQPWTLRPTLWVRQSDGKYEEQYLPTPPEDLAGKTPQWCRPNCVSQDGKVISASLVDYNGTHYVHCLYTQNDDGTWSYDWKTFADITYTSKFKDLWNAKPNDEDYITMKYGSADFDYKTYLAQIEAYNAACQEWENKLNAEGYTGSDFVAQPMLSDNGKWVIGACVDATADATYDCPAVYDVANKVYTPVHSLNGHVVGGITNDGDIVTYGEGKQGSVPFITLHSNLNEPIALDEMLKNDYGVDFHAALPSTTTGCDNPWVSGDGKVITTRAHYTETVESDGETTESAVTEIYCVVMKDLVSAIKNVLGTPTSDGIKVADGVVTLNSKAKDIAVYSVSGRLVASSANTSTLDASSIGRGVYLVKANVGGKTLTTKFIKR